MKPNERDDEMRVEFRAVLRAILDYLMNGETERAINYIRDILNDK